MLQLLENLGSHSLIEIKQGGEVYHVMHELVVKINDDIQTYGWLIKSDQIEPNSDSTLSQIIECYDSHVLFRGDECSCKILFNSKLEPKVYVQFDLDMLSIVLENNIEIFHDYEDQGFSSLSLTDLTLEDFEEDEDGFAEYWDGEFIVIDRNDYQKYKS